MANREHVPSEYVPQDGDQITIAFAPPEALDDVLASLGPETSLAELEQARELWASKGIDDYRLVGNVLCFCVGPQGPVTVTVNDGVVTSLIYADGATIVPKDPDFEEIIRSWTMESLFDEIEMRLGDSFHVRAEYDPVYGFPTLIEVDYDQHIFDEEYTREVIGLEVLGD